MSEKDILQKWKKLPEEQKQKILSRILQKASGKVLDPIDLDELLESQACTDINLKKEEK